MQRPKIDIYPVTQFVVQEVGAKPAGHVNPSKHNDSAAAEGSSSSHVKDNSALGKLMRLKQRFEREGGTMIRSVEGVLLFHEHGHPHILLCKHTINASGEQGGTHNPAAFSYSLPGGKCKGDEREVDCLLRKLGRRLLGLPKASVAAAALNAGANTLGVEQKEMTATHKTPMTSARIGVDDDDSLLSNGRSPANGLRQSIADHGVGPSPHSRHTHPSVVTGNNMLTGGGMGASPSQTLAPPAGIGAAGGRGPISSTAPLLAEVYSNAYAMASEYFRVGELLSIWYRPNFDRLLFPYIPPHITSVKERRSVFIVHVDPSVRFLINHNNASNGQQQPLAVGSHSQHQQRGGIVDRRKGTSTMSFASSLVGGTDTYELVAVPLFEVYQNAQKYGIIVQAIPDLISRFHINLC